MNSSESTEEEAGSEHQASASAPSDEKPSSQPQPPATDVISAPDIIPEKEKMRSGPGVDSYTITVTKTENHCPANELTTVVTTEEVVHDGGVTIETKVQKTTEHVVTKKTVETVIINSEEVCALKIFRFPLHC